MGRLDEKNAVITGGASGIGRATAILFAKEGARVVIADIQDKIGNQLAKEIGDNAMYIHTDVKKEKDIEKLIEKTVEKFGKIDVMFNNAGLGGDDGLIDEIPRESFDNTTAVLFRGMLLGMKHASKIMKTQKSGSIINTASVAGLQSGFGSHVYSSCKAAIIQLTKTTATELGPFGIRVNCIAPGGITTPLFGRAWGLDQEKSEKLVDVLKIIFEDIQPLKKAGLPEDIAKVALFFASDDSSFVSGQTLAVDGALTAGITHEEFMQKTFETAMKSDLPEIKEMLKLLGVEPPKND